MDVAVGALDGADDLGAGVGAEHEGLGGVDGDEHAGLLQRVGVGLCFG